MGRDHGASADEIFTRYPESLFFFSYSSVLLALGRVKFTSVVLLGLGTRWWAAEHYNIPSKF